MAPIKSILAASMLIAGQLVAGHAVITGAQGNAGGSGMALGVVSSTPRDGTRRNPFQQDATRFRGQTAQTVGETVGAGPNSVESGTAKIMSETGDSLPQVTSGGELTMTLHQVNADGAGPYTCMINGDGTGTSWDNIQVTQNVAGNNRGRNRDGNASDHVLKAAIPQGQQCTGTVAGESNVCLVRCQNPANAGPFGGVVPVQMAAAAGAPGAPAQGGNAAAPAQGGNAAAPAQGGNAAAPAQGGNAAAPAQGGNGAKAGNGAQGGNGAKTGAGAQTGNGAQTGAGRNGNQAGGRGGRNGQAGQRGGNGAQGNDQEEGAAGARRAVEFRA
ncbi:hypothetical protein PWT90_06168 [Aphanocladium album]|nr:hypothetical protein PWT90_06168 [Aphanocladium album]